MGFISPLHWQTYLSIQWDHVPLSRPIPHTLTRDPKLVSARLAPTHGSKVTLRTRKEFQGLVWLICNMSNTIYNLKRARTYLYRIREANILEQHW